MPRRIVTETSQDKSSGRAEKLRGKGEEQPNRIPVETCPAPECNLSTKDVKLFVNELKKYIKLFKPAFQRVEQIKKSLTYLHGLLGNTTRKNVEQMALGQKEKVRSLQYFVGQSQWETEPVIAIHQGLIGKTLGEEDVVGGGETHVRLQSFNVQFEIRGKTLQVQDGGVIRAIIHEDDLEIAKGLGAKIFEASLQVQFAIPGNNDK